VPKFHHWSEGIWPNTAKLLLYGQIRPVCPDSSQNWSEFGLPEFCGFGRTSLDSGINFQTPALTEAGIWLVEIRRWLPDSGYDQLKRKGPLRHLKNVNHFSKLTKHFWLNINYFLVDYYFCSYQTPKNIKIIF